MSPLVPAFPSFCPALRSYDSLSRFFSWFAPAHAVNALQVQVFGCLDIFRKGAVLIQFHVFNDSGPGETRNTGNSAVVISFDMKGDDKSVFPVALLIPTRFRGGPRFRARVGQTGEELDCFLLLFGDVQLIDDGGVRHPILRTAYRRLQVAVEFMLGKRDAEMVIENHGTTKSLLRVESPEQEVTEDNPAINVPGFVSWFGVAHFAQSQHSDYSLVSERVDDAGEDFFLVIEHREDGLAVVLIAFQRLNPFFAEDVGIVPVQQL